MTEDQRGVRRVRDPQAWTWFAERVRAQNLPWASAGSLLPADFDALVRIFHPAADGSTWAQVAAESGRVPHALMQWENIEARCGMPGRSGDGVLAWGDRAPQDDNPPAELVDAVLRHCPASGDVFFGVWDGYGTWTDREDDARLSIPGRDYYVFSGPKAALRAWPGMEPAWPQSPNLIWPADHSWVVASEIDWMFTLVAGSRAVTQAILADPALEAYPVAFDTSLALGSDRINPIFYNPWGS